MSEVVCSHPGNKFRSHSLIIFFLDLLLRATAEAEMKFEIQTFTDSEQSVRFTFYESWYNKSIIIVKEERFTDEDWAVVNSLSVPKELFSLLHAKGSTFTFRENLGSVGDAENTFHARTLPDRLELPLHVRKTLLDRDCEEIPLYENQMGYFNDLETLEWFWNIPKDGSSDVTKPESPIQGYPNPNVESFALETDSCIFTGEPSTSRNVLAIPPCDDSSVEGEIFVCEPPQTPTKLNPIDSPECPPAPKKRRIIRRPCLPTRIEPLHFSQF